MKTEFANFCFWFYHEESTVQTKNEKKCKGFRLGLWYITACTWSEMCYIFVFKTIFKVLVKQELLTLKE